MKDKLFVSKDARPLLTLNAGFAVNLSEDGCTWAKEGSEGSESCEGRTQNGSFEHDELI